MPPTCEEPAETRTDTPNDDPASLALVKLYNNIPPEGQSEFYGLAAGRIRNALGLLLKDVLRDGQTRNSVEMDQYTIYLGWAFNPAQGMHERDRQGSALFNSFARACEEVVGAYTPKGSWVLDTKSVDLVAGGAGRPTFYVGKAQMLIFAKPGVEIQALRGPHLPADPRVERYGAYI